MTRRTIRRYASELYPHPDEYEVRPLTVEVPYLYARAIGYEIWDTSWFDISRESSLGRELSHGRMVALLDARHKALLADALLQGLAGDEAWEWVTERMDDEGGWVYDRALHYGVPVDRIKPYPCGPEPDHHVHMESTGDITGHGLVTRIDCPEPECDACTEEVTP